MTRPARLVNKYAAGQPAFSILVLQLQVLRLQLVSEFQSRGSQSIFTVLLCLTLNFQSKKYIVDLENVTKIDRV